jgi:hypothetical protein
MFLNTCLRKQISLVQTLEPPYDVTRRGRVVMVGDTLDYLDIDPQFLSWVKTFQKLGSSQVVIEFMAKNPFEHEDPKFAPVGDYLFSPVDEWLTFESRPRCVAAIDLQRPPTQR